MNLRVPILSLVLVSIGVAAAHADTPSLDMTYDEVTPAYGVQVTGADDFETRYARISDAIRSGDYVSETALVERLRHLSDERMRESEAANKPSIFRMLLSLLPAPVQQAVNLATNHSPGALLGILAHAIPGLGRLAESELLAHLPYNAASAARTGNRNVSQQLLRASEFERTVGTLKHYSFYNGMERIDDVAGETAQIIQPEQRRTSIDMDLHEERYSIHVLASDYLTQLTAHSTGGTYAETGVETVGELPPIPLAGTQAAGFKIERTTQITVTVCGAATPRST